MYKTKKLINNAKYYEKCRLQGKVRCDECNCDVDKYNLETHKKTQKHLFNEMGRSCILCDKKFKSLYDYHVHCKRLYHLEKLKLGCEKTT